MATTKKTAPTKALKKAAQPAEKKQVEIVLSEKTISDLAEKLDEKLFLKKIDHEAEIELIHEKYKQKIESDLEGKIIISKNIIIAAIAILTVVEIGYVLSMSGSRRYS